MNATDNNGLTSIVETLEKVYTMVDWPWQEAGLSASLQQLGKSRADMWQLAGLIALERSLERANRACDLDFHARQQVTLLEGREACEIKLTKPLKFMTGRSDCQPDTTDPLQRTYVASKEEVGDGWKNNFAICYSGQAKNVWRREPRDGFFQE